MSAWGKTGTVRACAAGGRAADIYRRCVVGLYAQALLTLGDSALADDVVGGVIVDECAPPSVPGLDEDEARYRLAEPAFRRYRPLAAGPAWQDRHSAQRPSRAWPTAWILVAFWARNSEKHSGSRYPAALGMSGLAGCWVCIRVTFAGLLHTVLRRLAFSSAAVVEGGSPETTSTLAPPGTRDKDVGPAMADPLKRGEMMRTLGYAAAITVAAAGAALGLVVAVRGLQDARRYLKMKRM